MARGASWKKREGQRSRARESGRTRRRRRIAEEAEGSRRFQKQLELPRLVASGERGGGSWIGGEEGEFNYLPLLRLAIVQIPLLGLHLTICHWREKINVYSVAAHNVYSVAAHKIF